MNKIYLFTLLFLFIQSFGQNRKLPIGVAVDYQFLNRQSFSLGLSIMSYKRNSILAIGTNKKDYKIKTSTKEGYGIFVEYIPKDIKNIKDIYGFNFGFYDALKFTLFGAQVGYYSDFSNYKMIFIPEFGIGYKSIFFVYRRNIRLFGNGIDNINNDNLSVRLYIPIGQHWIKKE